MAHQLSMDMVRRRRAEIARQSEERHNGADFDTLKEGPNKRRILPPWSAEGNWRKYAGYHYNVVEKKALVCPKRTFQKPCPICEFVDGLYKAKTASDLEQAKKYRAKDRFFANVLNLDTNDGKVYVLAFGQMLEESIIDEMDGGQKAGATGGDQFGVGDITNPKTGRNMLMTKTVPDGKKELSSYKAKASGVASEVPNFAEIEKKLYDLDALVTKDIYTYEELMGFLMGEKPKDTPALPTNPNPAGATVSDTFETPKTDEFGQPATPTYQPQENPPPAVTVEVQTSVPASAPAAASALERLRAMKAAKTK